MSGVFELFTYPARRVVVHAQEEALRLNHNWIGTEHLLLGLFGEPEGMAAQALQRLGVGVDQARHLIVQRIGMGTEPPRGHIPFTPRAKRVMELAFRESVEMGHETVGTGHFLLGMIREEDGAATQVLVSMGVEPQSARNQVLEQFRGGLTEPKTSNPDSDVRHVPVEIESGTFPAWALQSVLFVLATIAAVLVDPRDSGLATAGLIIWGIGIVVRVATLSPSAPRWLGSAGPLFIAAAALIFLAVALIE